MAELGQSGLRAVIEASALIAAAADLPDLRRTAVAACGSLVDADLTSYNEITPGRPALVVADPGVEPSADEVAVMGSLIHQNPLVAHFAATGDGHARRVSDFLGDRELRALPLHREIYRDIGVNFQAAISTASPDGTVVGVAVSRARRDFTDAEVAALELLRPHLIGAHRRLTEIDWQRRMLAAIDADASAPAVVLVAADGTILRENAAAGALLGGEEKRIPGALRAALGSASEAPGREPSLLVFEHRGATVRARVAPGADAGTCVVSLSRPLPDALRLGALGRGLTGREAEVLSLLAGGGSNRDVAHDLGIGRRTVEKHLENAYRKLGVGGRAEAFATLFSPTKSHGVDR